MFWKETFSSWDFFFFQENVTGPSSCLPRSLISLLCVLSWTYLQEDSVSCSSLIAASQGFQLLKASFPKLGTVAACGEIFPLWASWRLVVIQAETRQSELGSRHTHLCTTILDIFLRFSLKAQPAAPGKVAKMCGWGDPGSWSPAWIRWEITTEGTSGDCQLAIFRQNVVCGRSGATTSAENRARSRGWVLVASFSG